MIRARCGCDPSHAQIELDTRLGRKTRQRIWNQRVSVSCLQTRCACIQFDIMSYACALSKARESQIFRASKKHNCTRTAGVPFLKRSLGKHGTWASIACLYAIVRLSGSGERVVSRSGSDRKFSRPPLHTSLSSTAKLT